MCGSSLKLQDHKLCYNNKGSYLFFFRNKNVVKFLQHRWSFFTAKSVGFNFFKTKSFIVNKAFVKNGEFFLKKNYKFFCLFYRDTNIKRFYGFQGWLNRFWCLNLSGLITNKILKKNRKAKGTVVET